jgi:hypothetical protein
MKTSPATPAPAPKTLTQQKTDFTAEGSPPPGQVATALPVAAHGHSPQAPQPATPVREAPKRQHKRPTAARQP